MDSSIPLRVRVKHEGRGSFQLDGAFLAGHADGRNGWLMLYPERAVVEDWADPAACGYNCLALKLTWTQRRRRVTCSVDRDYARQVVRVALEQALDLDHEQWSVQPGSVRLKARIRRSGEATKVRLRIRFTATPSGETSATTPRKGKLKVDVVLPREAS